MQGKVVRPPKYYRDTHTLMFVDGNRVREVMDIMLEDDERLADDIHAVAIDLDAKMDEIVALGDLAISGPESEWDTMAGAIPEKV